MLFFDLWPQMRCAKKWNVEKALASLLMTVLCILHVNVILVGCRLAPPMMIISSSSLVWFPTVSLSFSSCILPFLFSNLKIEAAFYANQLCIPPSFLYDINYCSVWLWVHFQILNKGHLCFDISLVIFCEGFLGNPLGLFQWIGGLWGDHHSHFLTSVIEGGMLKDQYALVDLVTNINNLWWGRIMRNFRGHYDFI